MLGMWARGRGGSGCHLWLGHALPWCRDLSTLQHHFSFVTFLQPGCPHEHLRGQSPLASLCSPVPTWSSVSVRREGQQVVSLVGSCFRSRDNDSQRKYTRAHLPPPQTSLRPWKVSDIGAARTISRDFNTPKRPWGWTRGDSPPSSWPWLLSQPQEDPASGWQTNGQSSKHNLLKTGLTFLEPIFITRIWFQHASHTMVFRTCYPQTWALGIVNILSWRSQRELKRQESHSDLHPLFTLLPETSLQTLRWQVLSGYPEEGSILISQDKGVLPRRVLETGLAHTPWFLQWPHSLTSIFLHHCRSPSALAEMRTRLLLHFPMSAPLLPNTYIE